MRLDAYLILKAIENRDLTTEALQARAGTVFTGKLPAHNFIDDLKNEMKSADCLHCGAQPFCRLYMALMYYKLGILVDAKNFTEEAILAFRIAAINWNEALSYWLMGILFLEEHENSLAERMLERALEVFHPKIHELQQESDYTQANLGKNCVAHIEQTLAEARIPYITPTKITIPSPAPLPAPAPTPRIDVLTPVAEGYIVLPWIPIFEDIQAGANGLIWIDPPNREKTELHQVVLQGTPCSIHPIHKGDHRVVINSERRYAWARVRGHSMEEATPTPICENDYVLFYRADSADNDSIVVVAQRGSGADDSCIVKRIDLDNELLFSQTNRKGEEYEPIPFNTERHLIAGVVVAIAKPTIQESLSSNYDPTPKIEPETEFGNQNEAKLPFMITKGLRQQLHDQGYSGDDISHMTPQQAWDKIDEEKLFQNLLTKVQGDHDVANRLIEHGRSQRPQSNRKELINLAILKWEKDNR